MQSIGRRTPFGNPITTAGGQAPGSTLPYFERYLRAALEGDRQAMCIVLEDAENHFFNIYWAQYYYHTPTGTRLRDALIALNPDTMFCPGCKNLTNTRTCHGSILLRLLAEITNAR